jgi:divalent metal cation (Fe/Co/Zn/Cd) transporter
MTCAAARVSLQATGAVYWDAIGSIAVSGLLGVVAVTLIQRNRKWLIGKSMPKVIRP